MRENAATDRALPGAQAASEAAGAARQRCRRAAPPEKRLTSPDKGAAPSLKRADNTSAPAEKSLGERRRPADTGSAVSSRNVSAVPAEASREQRRCRDTRGRAHCSRSGSSCRAEWWSVRRSGDRFPRLFRFSPYRHQDIRDNGRAADGSSIRRRSRDPHLHTGDRYSSVFS